MEDLESGNLESNLSVELPSGQVVGVTVGYDLKSKDLIVLNPVRSIDCQELPLSDEPVRLGQRVLVLGFPDFATIPIDSLSISPGYVVNTDGGWEADFLVVGTIAFGSSSSPLLDTQGRVIGMVGGNWGFRLDGDGNYIFDYTPLLYAVDVVRHLR